MPGAEAFVRLGTKCFLVPLLDEKTRETKSECEMPRYYFHVREAGTLSVDLEGAVLQGDDQAVRKAVQAARETLAEKILMGDVINDSSFEVVRADGHLIAVIPVSSVLRFQ